MLLFSKTSTSEQHLSSSYRAPMEIAADKAVSVRDSREKWLF